MANSTFRSEGEALRVVAVLELTELQILRHLYHGMNDLRDRVDQVQRSIRVLNEKEDAMTQELDALTTEVTNIEGQADSIITLCNGLAAQIDAAVAGGVDPAALTALAQGLRDKSALIAAAVGTDTRPQPAPVTPPAAA